MNNIIITGSGRAGTTVLMKIITALGYNTGFDEIESDDAGMELPDPIERLKDVHIIKSPELSDALDQVYERCKKFHVVICVRSISDVTSSRLSRIGMKGGLAGTENPDEQYVYLLERQNRMLEQLAKYDIDHTLIWFDKMMDSPLYLYYKLKPLLEDMEFSSFRMVYNELIDRSKIKTYTQITEPLESPTDMPIPPIS